MTCWAAGEHARMCPDRAISRGAGKRFPLWSNDPFCGRLDSMRAAAIHPNTSDSVRRRVFRRDTQRFPQADASVPTANVALLFEDVKALRRPRIASHGLCTTLPDHVDADVCSF